MGIYTDTFEAYMIVVPEGMTNRLVNMSRGHEDFLLVYNNFSCALKKTRLFWKGAVAHQYKELFEPFHAAKPWDDEKYMHTDDEKKIIHDIIKECNGTVSYYLVNSIWCSF